MLVHSCYNSTGLSQEVEASLDCLLRPYLSLPRAVDHQLRVRSAAFIWSLCLESTRKGLGVWLACLEFVRDWLWVRLSGRIHAWSSPVRGCAKIVFQPPVNCCDQAWTPLPAPQSHHGVPNVSCQAQEHISTGLKVFRGIDIFGLWDVCAPFEAATKPMEEHRPLGGRSKQQMRSAI